MHCYVQKRLDLSLDALDLLFDNRIQLLDCWNEVSERISDCKTACAMESCGINHHFSLLESFGFHLPERGRGIDMFMETIQVHL